MIDPFFLQLLPFCLEVIHYQYSFFFMDFGPDFFQIFRASFMIEVIWVEIKFIILFSS